MTTIHFKCDQCGQTFQVPSQYVGRRAKCTGCGTIVRIPPVDAAVVSQPPASLPAELQGSRPVISSPVPTGINHLRTHKGVRLAVFVWLAACVVLLLLVGFLFIARLPASLATPESQTRSGTAHPPAADREFTTRFSAPGSIPPATFGPPRTIPSEPGVELREVRLSGSGQPGQSGRLWVYLPQGSHPPRSLGCILVAPAGSNLLSGMDLGAGDQPEHYPYARAGFVVVAYDLAGPVRDLERTTISELRQAYAEFSAAEAGLVNAHNAFLYATTKIPEVDPNRVYAAGHSSAGTLALLLAAHETRLAGCIAYAPATDLIAWYAPELRRLEWVLPGCREFLRRSSPITHIEQIRCPLFLFHARDDSTVALRESQQFAERLRQSGGNMTFEIVNTGNHYDSMIGEGIPTAITWLKQRSASPVSPS